MRQASSGGFLRSSTSVAPIACDSDRERNWGDSSQEVTNSNACSPRPGTRQWPAARHSSTGPTGPGALSAHLAQLAIRESLAKRDPENTQWQVDVAISCAKLGSIDSLISMQYRKEYLCRGPELLLGLKQAGRFHANQDWMRWLDNALCSLQ